MDEMNRTDFISGDENEEYVGISYLCGKQLWNLSLAWHSEVPDLGLCVERTLLIWIPCLLVWLWTPVQMILIRRRSSEWMPWTYLMYAKITVTAVLMITALTELVWAVLLSRKLLLPINEFLAPSVLLVTYGLQGMLTILSHYPGAKSCGVLFCYWTIMVIAGIPQLITTILSNTNEDERLHVLMTVTFIVQYTGAVTLLILHCFAHKPTDGKLPDMDMNNSPAKQASFMSKITYHWANRLVWLGYKRTLTAEEMWTLPQNLSTIYLDKLWESSAQKELKTKEGKNEANNSDEFLDDCGKPSSIPMQRQYERQRNTQNYQNSSGTQPHLSIMKILMRCFFWRNLGAILLYLISECLVFASPILLGLIISFTMDPNEPVWHGYFYAILLFAQTSITTIVKNISFYLELAVGSQVQSTIMSAVFRKAMMLSNTARRESALGEIVNLMAIDSQRLRDALLSFNIAIETPFVVCFALYQLWQLLGPSSLAGLLVLFLLIPVNSFVANKIKALQTAQMKHKDKRIKLITEIINGIKVALATFITLLFVSDADVLTAKTAFVTISLINIMRMHIALLPTTVAQCIQANVSLKRLGRFMRSTNIDESCVCQDYEEVSAITISGGSFNWGVINGEEQPWKLKNVDMSVGYGNLVAVVGSVGSGKSSLISAILGELQKDSGRVVVNGNVAYVSQQAWLQNATLRENIIWGEPFDKEKYERVLEACALQPDLAVLPGGDMTEIGEKGINLSGGQKQRISLARAAFSNADIILLDDPFSAVDAHVGRHVFQNLIGPKGLMKGKTRLLVTHALWVLPHVSEIFVIKDGMLVETGSYSQLLKQDGDFAQFLLQHIKTNEDEVANDEESDELHCQEDDTPSDQVVLQKLSKERNNKEDGSFTQCARRRQLFSVSSSKRQSESETGMFSSTKSLPKLTASETSITSDMKKHNGHVLIQAEKVEIGKVKWKVYYFYAMAMGLISSLLPILFYAIAQSCQAGANAWLSRFSQEPNFSNNGTMSEEFDKTEFLIAYGSFGIGQSLFFYLGSLVMWTRTLVAGENIHRRLLANILHLPMSFFDTNPSGRIMNRLSKEIDVLDNTLPMFVNNALSILAQVATTMIVIIASTPVVALVIAPMMGMYYFVQLIYIASARQIKRIESSAKSPIFSYFSESLQGVSTIRAFGKQARFLKDCQSKIDFSARAFYTGNIMNRWLLLRLETLGNIITFSAAIFAVAGRGTISPGIVGLSISYALNITVMLNWLVRSTSEVEANIISVERIKEYIEEEQEAPWDIEGKTPSITWPSEGSISFNDYQARYRPGLDLVLKNVSCNILPGEKVGIVGRTGAGKSSLTLGLFRIIEAAGGSIDIDGINISNIGLHDLRGRLTIIPQDPVLFSGTLRVNLDPSGNHSDADLWQSLENAHLKDYVKSQTGGLQSTVDEGGSNLSVGQRQLVCLARALLRKSRVLVLDEATAAVDLETDDLIQATIRAQFSDCTILTIAHRLTNIMESDRVMVLDNGIIAEFDHPQGLLNNKTTIFHSMAKDAGLV